MQLSAEERRRLLMRLKRAEGQVAAVRRMVEADAYCVDILTQLAAARGALGKAGEALLRSHMQTCVAEAFQSGDDAAREQKVEELMGVFSRYSGIGGGSGS